MSKSFTGINPPEEIIDIERFKELKDLIPIRLSIIKMKKVKIV